VRSSRLALGAPARLAASLLRRWARVLDRLGASQAAAMVAPARDMADDADEVYYASQYRHWLEPYCSELEHRQATVLDLGCGQGRLALWLAERLPDASVVGVDVSPGAVARARGIDNLELREQDAVRYLASRQAASVDLALFTEVSFFMPGYPDALAEIVRALRPGGVLVASFRSRWFNLLRSVGTRHFQSALLVRDTRRGVLWDTPYEFCWHTAADVRAELEAIGLTVDGLYGLGVLSGLEEDPLSAIVRPSELRAEDQRRLEELEISLAADYADCGRYIVAVARRAET
jgi:SAM-dependent methyltransferase